MKQSWNTLPKGWKHVVRVAMFVVLLGCSACAGPGYSTSAPPTTSPGAGSPGTGSMGSSY